MEVYLARHGETSANREGIVLGRGDAPLTPQGIETMRRLAEILGGRGIQVIMTSPLGRAVASARIIAEAIDAILVPTEGLVELSCGAWEGRRRAEFSAGSRGLRATWTERPPGGESCRDAEPRITKVIERVLGLSGNGPLLVVGHSVANRVLLKLWYHLDANFANGLVQPHDLVHVLSPAARDAQGAPVRWLCADGASGFGWRTQPA
jgi:broad specificity phosphatase PhoE